MWDRGSVSVRHWIRGLAAIGVVLVILSGVAAESVVTGTATYRERIALPPDAVFEATLEDVSKADAPAELLSRIRVESPGQPPIRFEIPYDPARIQPNHTYSVRATIHAGTRLLFTTDQHYPVLTKGASQSVDLLLRRVSGKLAGAAATPSPLGRLPATYAGVLPCADCPGIEYHLDLFADRAYSLRTVYQGKPEGQFDDIGSWAVSSDGKTLILKGGREGPVMFSIKADRTLRKLDLAGREIASSLNYDLQRAGGFQPIEPRLAMRGMYRYLADAGLFTECLSGRRMPVAQEQDNAGLERAYGNARRQPGEELLVSLEGRIAMRPKIEGEGLQPTLVVERFTGVWPGETCGASMTTAALENTYWKLTRLGDQPVIVGARQREPHLIFRPEAQQVGGSAGCNRVSGAYRVQGSSLAFERMVTTKMACLEGMDTEQAFLAALAQVRSWRLQGQHLEVFDASGNLLARFEARYLK